MSGTSAGPGGPSAAGSRRMVSAAAHLCSDYQSIITEIRKAVGVFKGLAVELEKENKSEMVKQLDEGLLELLSASNDCSNYASSIEAVANSYQGPAEEVTDFSKVLESEFRKTKEESHYDPQANPLYRQFREAIWNVHHHGQPMPGEEQEELIVTGTQSNLLNMNCPLTGKPLIELVNPVRCMDCRHIYEKAPILQYIRTKKPQPQCPVAGCPKILQENRVVCDPLLPVEIDELRTQVDDTMHAHEVEDCTNLDDD